MEFSNNELVRRLAAARARMEGAGIDCLLLSSTENVCYFTGAPPSLYQQRRPWGLLIPLEDDPVAFTMAGTDPSFLGVGFVKDVVAYPLPVSEHLPALVVDRITRLRVKTLGCEFGLEQRIGMPPRDFDVIRAGLDGVTLVDAAELIWSLRMFKSAAEIDRIRCACQITGATRQDLFRSIGVGITEAEVAEEWIKLMGAAGAERPSFVFVNSGNPSDFLPSHDKVLKAGDTLWLDGGVFVGGYTSDHNRIATFGEASPLQRRLHRDAVEMVENVLAAIEPGLPISTLATKAAGELVARGYRDPGDATPTVAGHGLGQLTNEPPLVAPWDQTILSEGLLTTIEFGPVDVTGMYIWEEIIQVTSDGYELLTTEPTDLVEIEP